MKKVVKKIDARKISIPIVLTSSCLISAALLTGCQSTALSSSAQATSLTPVAAKTALADALQKQRRQSFSYHSNLEMSNQRQIDELAATQTVASDYVDSYCEDTHDTAYAALLAQSEAQNKDILSADYAVSRSAIKQSYQECAAAYQAWEDQRYADENDDFNINSAKKDSIESLNTDNQAINSTVIAQSDDDTITLTETRTQSSVQTKPPAAIHSDINTDYQTLFDNYDKKAREGDVKKAKLLDAYLLKPLSINAQGIYQPLAGRFTMLASTQYQTRNHHTSINQPLYIDFKNGDIYLWADNFALLNSEMLDDKLGTSWQNKWLKLAINDGTLPKGFGKAVIKSHFAATDYVYEQAPSSQFDTIMPARLNALEPQLPKQQLAAMQQSSTIIRRTQNLKNYEQSYYNYLRVFYDLMTEQYPQLVVDDTTAPRVYGTDKADFTSKALVKKGLTFIKNMVNRQSGISDMVSKNEGESHLHVQELYGFNASGKLQWKHLRSPVPVDTRGNTYPMSLDVLQQYAPINRQVSAFPNLPADMQTPNAANSVDLRDYSADLIEYYRDGNGTALGKMLMSVMPVRQTQ